jgi:proteasome lid subunit RPN8/RPN11
VVRSHGASGGAITDWQKAMDDFKKGDVVAGVYHTHPLNEQCSGDNPISMGDIDQFLTDVSYGKRAGEQIGSQYFSIVDSQDDIRHIVSVTNGGAQPFAEKYRDSWRDNGVSNYWQFQDSQESQNSKHMSSYQMLSKTFNFTISITQTKLKPLIP